MRDERIVFMESIFPLQLGFKLVENSNHGKVGQRQWQSKCGLWVSSAGTYCCKGQTLPEHDYGFSKADFELFSVNVRFQCCKIGRKEKTPAFKSVWITAIIVKLFTSSWFWRLHIATVMFFIFAGDCFKFIIWRSKHIFMRKQTNTTPATFHLWCVYRVGLAGWNFESDSFRQINMTTWWKTQCSVQRGIKSQWSSVASSECSSSVKHSTEFGWKGVDSAAAHMHCTSHHHKRTFTLSDFANTLCPDTKRVITNI